MDYKLAIHILKLAFWQIMMTFWKGAKWFVMPLHVIMVVFVWKTLQKEITRASVPTRHIMVNTVMRIEESPFMGRRA